MNSLFNSAGSVTGAVVHEHEERVEGVAGKFYLLPDKSGFSIRP
jgi:hypothetical protein